MRINETGEKFIKKRRVKLEKGNKRGKLKRKENSHIKMLLNENLKKKIVVNCLCFECSEKFVQHKINQKLMNERKRKKE